MAVARGRGVRQLALDLGHAESFAREDFLEGPSNAAALTMIERWPDWPTPVLALVGPEGAGKSHLAAIWAAEAGARFLSGTRACATRICRSRSRPARWWSRIWPTVNFDERRCSTCSTSRASRRPILLLTARIAPHGWTSSIPDLASRLRAIPVVTLRPARRRRCCGPCW